MLDKRHLLDPWRDAFILELRLQEVPGDRIGDEQRVHRPSPVTTGLAAAGLSLAVQALLSGVTALVQGESAKVTAGSPVAAVVAGVLVALFTHFLAALVRPGRRVILFAVVWVGMGAVLLPQALIQGTVLDGPAWVFLVAAVMLGAAVWGQLQWMRTDAVRDPRDGADLVPAPRWLQVASRWLLPAVLVLAVVTVVLAQ